MIASELGATLFGEGVGLESPDESRRENQAAPEPISRLSAAILRVNGSLDLNTVLQEVIESDRALTGARCGAITTVDTRGEAHDLVSSGLTSKEHRRLAEFVAACGDDGRPTAPSVPRLPQVAGNCAAVRGGGVQGKQRSGPR